MIANILQTVSIVVAVAIFLYDLHQRKKADTLQEIDEVFEKYYQLRDKPMKEHYSEYVSYVSFLERFAMKVRERLLLKSVVKKRMSIFLRTLDSKFLGELIDKRRKQFGRDSYYQNVTWLIEECKGNGKKKKK